MITLFKFGDSILRFLLTTFNYLIYMMLNIFNYLEIVLITSKTIFKFIPSFSNMCDFHFIFIIFSY